MKGNSSFKRKNLQEHKDPKAHELIINLRCVFHFDVRWLKRS
jgi:hypothetical protein